MDPTVLGMTGLILSYDITYPATNYVLDTSAVTIEPPGILCPSILYFIEN